ncbi:hypothetical protein DSO57_1016799 [Entomophthora muscae]|uniref:Uncharacterized protein n=1 Tax=Entomophthora muscae TaxID=34485 RepID=A0ACC2STY2_9FUNG|nr:hypothetical protein DSO57_1016799 [Entomophthora muscae]
MARNGSSFKANIFDPLLLVGQILAFQSINYISLSLLLLVASLLNDNVLISLEPIFNYNLLNFDSKASFLYITVYLIHTIPSMLALVYIVERAKLCYDFVITYHFWHIIASMLYCKSILISIPAIVLYFVTTLITILGGEYLCMNRELTPIILSGGNNANSAEYAELPSFEESSSRTPFSAERNTRENKLRQSPKDDQIQILIGNDDQGSDAFEMTSLGSLHSRVPSPALSQGSD